MFLITHKAQQFQVTEFSLYGNNIMFACQRSHDADAPINTGVIYVGLDGKLQGVEINGQTSDLFFDKWVYPKGGPARYNNFVQITKLGSVKIVTWLENETFLQDIVTIQYAHLYSPYMSDPCKLYYMAGNFAAATTIRLMDNSTLKRGWINNTKGTSEPCWIYERHGVTHHNVTVNYIGVL